MTTSGTSAFAMTAHDMVRQAMIELGVISSGEEPTADEMSDGIFRLNSMLKSLQAKGCGLWREQDASITITGGAASVALSTTTRNVFGARLVVSATNERPLTRWERSDYLSLPNKATVGNPSAFYPARGRDGVTVYFWPVPSTNQTVLLDAERIVETVTDGSQAVDVPMIWFETVWKCLAARMANMFGATLVSPAVAQKVTMEAMQLEAALLDDDRPESIFMGPE